MERARLDCLVLRQLDLDTGIAAAVGRKQSLQAPKPRKDAPGHNRPLRTLPRRFKALSTTTAGRSRASDGLPLTHTTPEVEQVAPQFVQSKSQREELFEPAL